MDVLVIVVVNFFVVRVSTSSPVTTVVIMVLVILGIIVLHVYQHQGLSSKVTYSKYVEVVAMVSIIAVAVTEIIKLGVFVEVIAGAGRSRHIQTVLTKLAALTTRLLNRDCFAFKVLVIFVVDGDEVVYTDCEYKLSRQVPSKQELHTDVVEDVEVEVGGGTLRFCAAVAVTTSVRVSVIVRLRVRMT